ncbi:uncharacterized protein LOC109719453 isoform X1 [Ananas comosus]|uniref:Uncharacterized protein LOC109719453 isoform X1 n=1 Tax=Ananas comosus TaxID=4615 RepID=A0A6P5G061_ANACO|nr:uncharacterized protein LOC109719453 isoform X1 [Ananas comosus]
MKMLALCGLRFHLREADRVEASRLQSRGPAVWSRIRSRGCAGVRWRCGLLAPGPGQGSEGGEARRERREMGSSLRPSCSRRRPRRQRRRAMATTRAAVEEDDESDERGGVGGGGVGGGGGLGGDEARWRRSSRPVVATKLGKKERIILGISIIR